MAAATIRDVARKANVGIATVSRVINDSTAVSEETRKKVLEAIEELDYRPNITARRLSTGRTHNVAVILPFLTLPSFVERLRGVQKALTDSEYDLVLFSVETPKKIDNCLSYLSHRARVDGAIIISIKLTDDQVNRFRQSNVKIVLIDAIHPKASRIIIDDVKGGYLATNHLIQLGHKKIAFLSDFLENPFNFTSMKKRYKGHRQALKEADIQFRPEYHMQGKLGGREAYQRAIELLTLPDRPTAIFAASDTHAVGILNAAHELGLKIPQDLSVIGYDDIRDAEYLNLCTIRQHLLDSGIEGAKILLSALKQPFDMPQEILMPTKLVVRGTTSPPQ